MFASVAHAMGTAGAGQAGGADALMQFVPLIAMLAIFYFLLIRPQQKRAKQRCNEEAGFGNRAHDSPFSTN